MVVVNDVETWVVLVKVVVPVVSVDVLVNDVNVVVVVVTNATSKTPTPISLLGEPVTTTL